MDESNLLGFLHSNIFDASEVMHCNDYDCTINAEATSIEQPAEVIKIEEHKTLDSLNSDNFIFPEMPDDINDDYSWLVKFFPSQSEQTDHIVPDNESHLVDQGVDVESINKIKETSLPAKDAPISMLVDAMLSEMDVSSLISNEVEEITFHKDDTNVDGVTEQQEVIVSVESKSLKSRTKRSTILRNRKTTEITDTPVRRSQRKRSYQEITQTEINRDTSIIKSGQRNKRARIQSNLTAEGKAEENMNEAIQETAQVTENDMTATGRILYYDGRISEIHEVIGPRNTQARIQRQTKGNMMMNATVDEEPASYVKPVKNELKIIFRKHKPVNPIAKSVISTRSYKRGLIDPSRQLPGERYLKHATAPNLLPISVEGVGAILAQRPLTSTKLMQLLKVDWIENHNAVANVKAHGNGLLGNKKLTSDGNAIRGVFVTMDLDSKYENILQMQNNLQIVNDWKSNIFVRKYPNLTEVENPVNLDNTFSNFSNFNNYFTESSENYLADDEARGSDCDRFNGSSIIGIVPVNKSAISENSTFSKNWSLFRFRGQTYRPNPVVVTIVRLSDDIIEQMKSKPQKVTLQSTYYKALTSYFEKRSNQ